MNRQRGDLRRQQRPDDTPPALAAQHAGDRSQDQIATHVSQHCGHHGDQNRSNRPVTSVGDGDRSYSGSSSDKRASRGPNSPAE